MREILFRGQRCDTGEWIEGYFIQQKNNLGGIHSCICKNFESENRWEMIRVNLNTVCQYTGLTDKNGRKIFEGDIVRYTDEVIGKEKVDEVEYNETHAAFCRLHKGKMGLQYLFIDECIANKCEVIGNIFDNPELLEQ